MRAHDKKKRDKIRIKEMVKKGLYPDSNGQWIPNNEKNSMGRDIKGGHKA